MNETALPKKVREAGERAEKELKALMVDPKAGEEGSQGEPEKTILGLDGKPIQAAPGEGTPPVKKEEGKVLDWKAEHETLLQRHKVLKGKFDNEVPILHSELRNLKETLTKLQERSPENPAQALTVDEATVAPEVPEKVIELYGETLINFIGERARFEATNVVKPFAEKVETVAQENENTRKNAFFTRLSEAHSDWEQINDTTAWMNFLKEIVPELGYERQWIINNAIKTGNPEPIILQLTAFKQRSGSAGEQTNLAMQETPSGEGKPSAGPVEDGEVEQIKESDIAAFYTDAAQGKYKNREKEFAHLEKMIQDASKAGKIVMDVSGGKQPLFQ